MTQRNYYDEIDSHVSRRDYERAALTALEWAAISDEQEYVARAQVYATLQLATVTEEVGKGRVRGRLTMEMSSPAAYPTAAEIVDGLPSARAIKR